MSKSFVEVLADSICAQYPAGALDTALAVVSAVAMRQRLAAVRDFSRGKEPAGLGRQDQVLSLVCRHFGIELSQLTSEKRTKRLVAARVVAWHLLRTELRMSSTDIGTLFRRDHSTVLHGFDRMEADEALAADARDLSLRLKAQWGTETVEAAE